MSKYKQVLHAVIHDEALEQLYPDWSCTTPRRDMTEDEIAAMRPVWLREKLEAKIKKQMMNPRFPLKPSPFSEITRMLWETGEQI